MLQNVLKIEIGTFENNEKISKNSLIVPKKTIERKGLLVFSGILCYAEKGTTIKVQFPGPNDTILPFKI